MGDASDSASELDRAALLAVLEATRLVGAGRDLQSVFTHMTEAAARIARAQAASLLTVDSRREELVFRALHGPASEQLASKRIGLDQGIAGQVARTQRAVRIDDVRENANFLPAIDEQTQMRTSSMLAAPLIAQSETLGVIEVLNPIERASFGDDDLKRLEVFANIAALAMRNAERFDQCRRENTARRTAAPAQPMIGGSAAIENVIDLCSRVARAPTTVLITGPTGAGKEVAARFIHEQSARSDRPFIAVNCAALSENLIESELFGHERGAFTGAENKKQGWFELADHGTLFLDEVGEIPMATQAKLLRVIQEGEFTTVGGTEVRTCDVRVIAATNRDLRDEVQAGRFREDLYYRLSVFPIPIPPLRDRLDDLPLLASHLATQIAREMGFEPQPLSQEVLDAMARYHWPGNIRELRNVLERCLLLGSGEIMLDDIPGDVLDGGLAGDSRDDGSLMGRERALIVDALEQAGWNRSEAARKLGVTRDVLRYRMKKHNISENDVAG